MRVAAETKISVHDTDTALWNQLLLVFPLQSGERYEWVAFTADNDVSFTFFAPDDPKAES